MLIYTHSEPPRASLLAPPDHEAVARLEDVQRAGNAGEGHRAHKDGDVLGQAGTGGEITVKAPGANPIPRAAPTNHVSLAPRSDSLEQSNTKASTWLTKNPRTNSAHKTAPCRDAPSSPGAPWGTSAYTQPCCDIVLEAGQTSLEKNQAKAMVCGEDRPLRLPCMNTHAQWSKSLLTWRALPSQPGAGPCAQPAQWGRWPV